MHKQCSCSHAKNENLLKSVKPYIFKNDAQMWMLHRKLNFPNMFRLVAIYTPAPAFKDNNVNKEQGQIAHLRSTSSG